MLVKNIAQWISKRRAIFYFLFGFFFVFIFGSNEAFAATAIYRSVAPSATSALDTGSADANTLSISGSTATFSIAVPNDVGVGDAIQYDSDDNGSIDAIAFIHGRTSSTVYTVKNTAGGTPTATSVADTDWSTFRAYISLVNAETGTENTGIDDAVENFDTWSLGKSLTASDEQWNITLYANSTTADSTAVVIDGWTTDSTRYLRVYTPTSTSEVGTSQRNVGIFDTNKYYLSSTSTIVLDLRDAFIRIQGLQIWGSLTTGTQTVVSLGSGGSSLTFSENILKKPTGGTSNIVLSTTSSGSSNKIYNNIIYDIAGSSAIGINDASGSGALNYIYNNTIANIVGATAKGIDAKAFGLAILKNNLIYNVTNAAAGTAAAGSDYNATNNASMGYTVTGSGNTHDKTSQTFTFVDAVNKDFHIDSGDAGAKDSGVDLSADPNIAFTTDIDGQTRSGTWDIGADEIFVPDVTPPTVSTFSPVDNATGVLRTDNLVLTFDEAVNQETGNITIKKTSDDSTIETIDVTSGQVTGDGTTTITINPSVTLDYSTEYYVLIDATAFDDLAGNSYAGIASTTAWSFTTEVADATPPTVSTLSPADDATGVSRLTNLVITFDENVVALTGNIIITETGVGAFETIPANDAKVTIVNNVVTINPAGILNASTAYHVTIANDSFEDAIGNNYAGISSSTAWNFTTGTDNVAPTPGNSGALSASAISGTALTLNWTEATDDISAQTSLQYEVRRSSSANIDNLANAEANGTIIGAYTADISSLNVTGLTINTAYYFNVIVKDETGNKAAYTMKSLTTPNWTPPVGIPSPTFGLGDEMEAEPAEWPGSVNTNWFFIDNSVTCTDTANTNGTPNNPRCTIPSVTFTNGQRVILGNGHINTGGQLIMTFNCSASEPCFFRSRNEVAVTSALKAQIMNSEAIFKGKPAYVIIEHIYFNATVNGVVGARLSCHSTAATSYIAVRHNLFVGDGIDHDNRATISTGGCSSLERGSYHLIWDNVIHGYGATAQEALENDYHGVAPDTNSDYVWVVDNNIYNMGGDSIQIGTASTADENRVDNIYVGRNLLHENHENGVDIKEADNVIVSGNTIYTHVATVSSAGECVVAHDSAADIWLINNIVYDCPYGIIGTGQNGFYIVGNLIRDTGTAFQVRGNGANPLYVTNNTITSSDTGIYIESGQGVILNNNIISGMTGNGPLVNFSGTTDHTGQTITRQLFSPSSEVATRVKVSSTNYASLVDYTTAFPAKCSGCLEGSAQFTNSAGNDYTITSTSLARNAGETPLEPFATFLANYSLNIETDLAGIGRPEGVAWDIGAYEFEEVNDVSSPNVSTLSPSDNATGVSVTANLVLTFDEAVNQETGNITIKKTSDDSTIETIDVTSGQVTGDGTTTITINPSVTLDYSTEYYILVAATAFDDLAGNSYAGIASTTAWSFTTTSAPDVTAPVLSSGLPTGEQSSNTTEVIMSLTTNEASTCKYGTIANTAYASIANTFTTTGGTAHSQTITGLRNDTSYNYYIRCTDGTNINSSDYTISFSVASPAGNITGSRSTRSSLSPTNTITNPSLGSGPLAYNLGTTTLKLWSRGQAVKELQRFLNDKLNLGLVLDGILGPKTIAVIKKWQKAHNLVPDGLVGPLTKAKMKQL